ncbi:MAG TPA: hypothetical protein VL240_08525 [Candidatus Binatia bacterium]|nr:hypothetical protein [Candidatus Binatia bacterium]
MGITQHRLQPLQARQYVLGEARHLRFFIEDWIQQNVADSRDVKANGVGNLLWLSPYRHLIGPIQAKWFLCGADSPSRLRRLTPDNFLPEMFLVMDGNPIHFQSSGIESPDQNGDDYAWRSARRK